MITDLLVLGAGPAGAAISLLMAAKGYTVEVIDSAYFPRPRICGEFLNPQAVKWLNEQGLLSEVESLKPFMIRGMRITSHQRTTFRGNYQNAHGYAIQRKDFDALLVSKMKQLGIHLEEGFRANELICERGRVVGIRGMDAGGTPVEKRASVIVGADGRNNLIGRSFGWMRDIPGLRKYAYLTYFEGVTALDHYGEIHLIKDGYIGVAPLNENLANVAVVIDEQSLPANGTDPLNFLLEHIQQSELALRIANRKPIIPVIGAGPLAFRVKQTSGYGTILVGDTCGFIDPFTGEGINYAFVSASIAADVLHRCFRQKRFDNSLLMEYDKRRKQTLGRKFQMARLLQKALHSPRTSEFLVRRFASDQSLADTMVSAVGSAIPVQAVWNPSFLMRIIFGGVR